MDGVAVRARVGVRSRTRCGRLRCAAGRQVYPPVLRAGNVDVEKKPPSVREENPINRPVDNLVSVV